MKVADMEATLATVCLTLLCLVAMFKGAAPMEVIGAAGTYLGFKAGGRLALTDPKTGQTPPSDPKDTDEIKEGK